MTTFANQRTSAAVDTAQRAASAGNYARSLDLLAEADGLEAWAGVLAGTGSRAAIAATIASVGQRRAAADRQRAAAELAADFGDDISEWTV